MKKQLSAEEKQLFPILIVSRRTSIRLSLQRYLDSSGYSVFTAEEGEEGIELDADTLSQLLIIDTPLADMPLEQFLGALLKSRNLMKDVMQVTNVPVILLAGSQEAGMDERKFKKYGILAKLDKPVNLGKLAECINDILTGNLSVEAEAEIPIVILDPEERAQDYFAKLLTADDVDIITCKDEIDLRAIEHVGVLILEVMGLTSDDPTEFIKAYKEAHPKTELMVTTAFHDDDMSQEMRDAGASEIIMKPINPIKFRQTIREAVSRYQVNRQRDED